MKFKVGDLIREDHNLGIVLASGERTFDIVWVGGSTSRYRYTTGRAVRLATPSELAGQEARVDQLRNEAADAREERRTGARRKRGQIWPSR